MSSRKSGIKLQASYEFEAKERWESALIGRNLSDEFLVYDAGDSPSTGSGTGTNTAVLADQVGVVGRPREIALQLTAKF